MRKGFLRLLLALRAAVGQILAGGDMGQCVECSGVGKLYGGGLRTDPWYARCTGDRFLSADVACIHDFLSCSVRLFGEAAGICAAHSSHCSDPTGD